MSKSTKDVLAERHRQQDKLGWTPEHDDKHEDYSLSGAARCYMHPHNATELSNISEYVPRGWPWCKRWWKPKTYRENLVRAGALIIAEIERLDRRESKS